MNDSLVGLIAGAVITGLFGLFFGWINSIKKAKETADSNTIDTILETIKTNATKELHFKEEWGGFKNEVRSISSSADAIKEAAKDIIIMRRDLNTCFVRIDELKNMYSDNNLLLKKANTRLFMLKTILEKKDPSIIIDNEKWLMAKDHIEG